MMTPLRPKTNRPDYPDWLREYVSRVIGLMEREDQLVAELARVRAEIARELKVDDANEAH